MAALRTERSSRAAASTESADRRERGRERVHTAFSHSPSSSLALSGSLRNATQWERRACKWLLESRVCSQRLVGTAPSGANALHSDAASTSGRCACVHECVYVCVLVCLRCHNKILTQWFINKRAPHSTTKSARVRASQGGRLRRGSRSRRERAEYREEKRGNEGEKTVIRLVPTWFDHFFNRFQLTSSHCRQAHWRAARAMHPVLLLPHARLCDACQPHGGHCGHEVTQ